MNHDPTKELHAEYERLSGLSVVLTMTRIYAWEAWIARGWTVEDLGLVLKALLSKAKSQNRTANLRFSTIVENCDRFEEELAEARARNRTKKPAAGKASVLRASGRPAEAPLPRPVQVGDVLKGAEALAAFRAMRDSL